MLKNTLKKLRANLPNALDTARSLAESTAKRVRERIPGGETTRAAEAPPRALQQKETAKSAGLWEDDGVTPTPDDPRTLVLYKDARCEYCEPVLARLDEMGLIIPVRDIREEPRARVDLWDETGRMTTPCLFIDGVPLFESERIITWLEAFDAAMS